jgi:hypothetical protein
VTSHLAWPPELFYWSVVDAPQWTRAGTLPPGMLAALEEDLPVPADSVHAVGAPLGRGRVLVCALARERLVGVDAGTQTLRPASLPDFIERGGSAQPDLNMLVGAFEPITMRRARVRRHGGAAAAVVLLAALASTGLLRRAGVWAATASEAAAARTVALAAGTRPETLDAEVARLDRLRDLSAQVQPPADAAAALASLLSVWPAAVPSSPHSVAVNQAAMSISVSLDGDATPFLNAFRPPTGWTLEEPRHNRAGTLTRLTLQLKPQMSTGTPGP